MEKLYWCSGKDDTLVAEISEITMKVKRTKDNLYGRFIVSSRSGRILGSGTVSDIETAKHAARKMAERCAKWDRQKRLQAVMKVA
ncbi:MULTISPECIES: hypothetical protein [unclassified Acidocella]|uniref:hypothetical protein n=1 Tax=unclassified Acidocella TaxID=2648610 RepID=UPI00118185F2|nr:MULTISPECIES: hypothetical protein [unclassified Acidocella]WBO59427.1 hypothetical protein GT370_00275 [Acidocella sp. MX-AZ03]